MVVLAYTVVRYEVPVAFIFVAFNVPELSIEILPVCPMNVSALEVVA